MTSCWAFWGSHHMALKLGIKRCWTVATAPQLSRSASMPRAECVNGGLVHAFHAGHGRSRRHFLSQRDGDDTGEAVSDIRRNRVAAWASRT